MTIRKKYKRGLEKELNAVYIGRPWGPFKYGSKWGNPFKTGRDGTIDDVFIKYKEYIIKSNLLSQISELKDKLLICWCNDDKPCHGDILIELIKELDNQ